MKRAAGLDRMTGAGRPCAGRTLIGCRRPARRYPGARTGMKVLIADKFPDGGRAALAQAGVAVVYDPELKGDALAQAVRSTAADVLVVRGTKVPAAALTAGRLS